MPLGRAGSLGLQAVYSSNPDRGLQELAAMWPEIVAALSAFRGRGLRLVVTYGWEGLRTWNCRRPGRNVATRWKRRSKGASPATM